MSDIRKWFVKKHDKDNSNAAKPAAAKPAASKPASEKPSATTSETQKAVGQESAARRKTSKYFDKDQEKSKVGTQKMEVPAKPSPAKKVHKLEEENVDDDDDDFAPISSKKKSVDATPSKKLKGSSGRGIAKKNVVVDESDEEMDEEKETPTPVKSAGRVRGRGAAPATAAGGGGRGRGRGGFMNFGERKDPPHKGEKEVPEGSPDCLAGLTFVISGTLDSLEREEAEDLIKRHGGRVTGSVSKKTNFLLCDDDIGGRKSEKAKELGTPFLTEDGLFDMIQKSKKSKTPDQCNSKKPSESTPSSSAKKIQQNVVVKKADVGSYSANSQAPKSSTPAKKKDLSKQGPSLTWTEKYKPKVPNEIIGNQKLVKDLHDWLSHWDEQFLHNKGKRKRESNSAEKKAVLMSGTPGIGKTTSAKLVSKMLKYEIIEVNASDNRGKADSQIGKGIGGSTANSVKELISNKSLGDLDRLKHPKTVLIMDEVDGMSAGDRGGVADVIASIKISKVPIICICNDRYSQKLKSLVNYCSLYNFRKPTKQQMAKRLLQIANAEGIQVNEIALEELAERCNGDMRMAVNQLQYMSLSMSVIKYDDIRQRLLNNAKDEDISPFTAVDKLFGYNGGKLRMDERIDLSMSDLDLVPLLIQENYINYRPSSIGKDDSAEIGNCKSLVRLRLFNNRIIGEIPKEIGFLGSLSFLDLSYNRLSGSVPEEISKCKELQMLNLSNNTIRGSIPDALSSLSKLQALDLSYNQLTGPIPDGFGQLDSINSLILRGNSLSGSIPSSLGSCLELQLIDLSSNGFSGRIPQELFQIQDLDIALNLSCNNLSGVIPPQISSLKKLNILDMSHNRLEGSLMQLSALDNLVSLNVSYNNFTGFLPDNKLFRQLSSKELEGNQGLCSQNHDSCFVGDGIGSDTGHSRQSKKLKLAIGLLVALTVILVALGVVAVARARKMIKDDSESEIGMNAWPWQFTPFQKLNFALDDVLKSLVESNIIGKGCSGIVYRAEMENGELIAVKKLWPATMGAKQDCHKDRFKDNGRDSFSGEVKTLGSIRHKNIVRFLGCCWNKNTRLLMYDYMPNGSLGSLLHERSGSCLDWDLRYKIILGAAQGLAYMHHDCVPPIVHRDIKVNNILIGLDFEPYIADFGLAKLVDDGDFARSSSTVAGSYGYMAPEYGYMMKVTEKSDVYSFGVVMLEVLTGKQPIDPTIPDGLHIVEWVRLRKGGADVIDQQLKGRSEPEVEEMMQTIGVALLCVTPTPNDRPTMKDVAAMLKEIRQDREADCTKADTVLKGSPMSKDQQTSNTNSSKGGPSTAMQQQLYTRSNNTSFSASSLLYSSSNGNITFK